jgi:hypothetical protein
MPATDLPLQAPAEQAAHLVALHRQLTDSDLPTAAAYVREILAPDVIDPTRKLWAVQGHDGQMTSGQYAALVVAEIDRLAAADPVQVLWTMLRDAEWSATRAPGNSTTRAARLAYRDGLFDAYLLITGKDPEEVHDALISALDTPDA